jgi:hypothetical protein
MIKNKIFPLIIVISILLTACAGTPASNISQPAEAVSTSQPANTQTADVAPQVNSTNLATSLTYPIVDTGQGKCYDNKEEVTCPQNSFVGQDAQYTGNAPSYTLSADGLTVNDNVTSLIWQRSPDTNNDGILNKSDKLTMSQAQGLPTKLNASNFGGYNDWRLPTIKELFSLIDFRGTDPSGASGSAALIPFIDTTYFQFAYGDSNSGERTIDSQYASSTSYVNGSAWRGGKLFGVNFADGRIKGYDLTMPDGSEKTFFVICVRGNNQYGINVFVDNGDQTITDNATGLMWSKTDSGVGLNWQDSLAWVQTQNAANYLGHNDWRLPNVKELQSIVDYGRSADTTNSAAIDPIFNSSQIKNEAGQTDFPFYWSGTTHAGSNGGGETADYISFGRALGYMNNAWVDVHGAGAQRSDPKSGDALQFPQGRGPQGDTIRINNYVRLVRGGQATFTPDGNPSTILPSLTVNVTETQMQPQGTRSGQSTGGQGTGQQPPQAAIDSCLGLTQDAACTVNTPYGIISGTCGTPPNSSQMTCMPAGGPPNP